MYIYIYILIDYMLYIYIYIYVYSYCIYCWKHGLQIPDTVFFFGNSFKGNCWWGSGNGELVPRSLTSNSVESGWVNLRWVNHGKKKSSLESPTGMQWVPTAWVVDGLCCTPMRQYGDWVCPVGQGYCLLALEFLGCASWMRSLGVLKIIFIRFYPQKLAPKPWLFHVVSILKWFDLDDLGYPLFY